MRRKILSLLIFVIILCVYPLYTAADIRTFTHEEQKEDFGPTVIPRVFRASVYDDNTIVLRIFRKNTTVITPTATSLVTYSVFSLRIIYPNGTVFENDIDLGIQSFNYNIDQLNPTTYRPGGLLVYLNYYLIRMNQILVTYFNATDVNDPKTYEERAMIIDFNGKKYGDISIGPAFLDVNTGGLTWDGNSVVVVNINEEKGFAVFSNIRGYAVNGHTGWQQYKVETDGTFTKLTSGEFSFYSYSLIGTAVATIDEGYAFAFANTSFNANASTVSTDPLSAQSQISIVPIGYNQSAGSPLILYQTSLLNITFKGFECGVAFAGIGQTCVINISQNGVTSSFVQIDFLSTGAVIDIKILDESTLASLIPVPPSTLAPSWGINSLQYGGFLLVNAVSGYAQLQPTRSGIFGYLFNGTQYYPWPEFPEPELSNVNGVYVVLPNNTLLVAQIESGNSWQFQAIDLPRLVGDRDKGYSNVHVEGTYPKNPDTINPKSPLQLSIDFYDPVSLSNGQLSIYQITDDQRLILRQTIPADTGFLIRNDSRTVIANVLESTFSVSNGNYFITFDNEFVKDMSYNEALLGIKNNVWKITTERVTDKFAPSTDGLLRLTPNGTIAFDNFSPEKKQQFFEDLKNTISLAAPVDLKRLTTTGNIQVDKGLNEKQYLVSIGILETRVEYDNSVATIINLVDVMVKHQDQSPIGTSLVAGFLDKEYGFTRNPSLWEKYKTRLIGLFVIIGIFFVLLGIAYRRDKEGKGNNIAIIRLGVILFDLIMDILFVSTSARDVPVLYIPSVVFVTLPIAINTTLASYIISEESTKPKFYQWFKKNGSVASIFTLLAGADIEALTILESKLAGFDFFDAPYSESAETKIFWGAFLNIFTEDIPQVVIQIYYRKKTVAYDIIPLLTLISSSVNLIINIVGRLYQATNRMRNLNVSKYRTPNDDSDFGDLANINKDALTTERSIAEQFMKTDEKTDEKIEKTDEKTDEKIEKTDEKTEKTDEKTDEKTEKTEITESVVEITQ